MRLLFLLSLIGLSIRLLAQPIALHPENPHYLSYQGKPSVLITSAEHYGAVLNTAFDYEQYLQTLQAEGMNYTRIFTGSYVELPGSFGIENNTLSPAKGEFLAPWMRVAEAGLYEGEGKFDLSRWNPAYFSRLKAFIEAAAEREVIVEVTFFCATYQDAYWTRHPFHPDNNINELGKLARQDFNTLKNEKAVHFQQELVRKITTELNRYDNVFYEISNEPWSDNEDERLYLLKTLKPANVKMKWALASHAASQATLDWQKAISTVFAETEANLPKRHLLAQNYCNFKQSLPAVDPAISLINFHYAWPEVVGMNYGWDRPISFDESGFAGAADSTYLEQAWAFMIAGGAIFNNLDYSFFVGAEDGSGKNQAPGGGSQQLRKQLKILRDFIESFDFVKMKPAQQVLFHTPGLIGQALAEPGKQYAIFLAGQPGTWIELDLPKGKYAYRFLSPDKGETLSEGEIKGMGGPTRLSLPQGAGYRLALSLAQK